MQGTRRIGLYLNARQIMFAALVVILLPVRTIFGLNIEKWAERHKLDNVLSENEDAMIDVLVWLANFLVGDLFVGFIVGGAVVSFWGLLAKLWRKEPEVIATPQADEQPLTVIEDTDFTDQTISIDDKHFVNCTFNNTLIHYEGGNYKFTHCPVAKGTMNLLVKDKNMKRLIGLQRFFGLFNLKVEKLPFDKTIQETNRRA